jgi:hypothetical protein
MFFYLFFCKKTKKQKRLYKKSMLNKIRLEILNEMTKQDQQYPYPLPNTGENLPVKPYEQTYNYGYGGHHLKEIPNSMTHDSIIRQGGKPVITKKGVGVGLALVGVGATGYGIWNGYNWIFN